MLASTSGAPTNEKPKGKKGGQTELQAEGYTAVEDSVLRLLRELMQDRLTPEPTPSQWDRVIELLCDENFDIRRLLQVHQSLCKQRTASPYFERALQHLEEIICSGVTDKELHFVDSTRENLTRIFSYSKKEFDPGSEGTLAICLTHASRTLFSGSWTEGTKTCASAAYDAERFFFIERESQGGFCGRFCNRRQTSRLNDGRA